MPLFGKRKPRLDALIADAAADARAYDRLYEGVPLHQNAAKEAFQCVIQSVVVKPAKENRLRGRLLPTKGGRGGGAGGGHSSDPAIRQSVAYLTVLHGVVWSFPYTMNVLFTDQETCMLIQKFILSVAIPLTVRETMLAMVSNWCVLYRPSLRARINLENIVDLVEAKVNLRPVARLLPVPPYTLEQKGWQYPAAPGREIHAHGSMPALAGRHGGALQSPEAAAAAFSAGAQLDSVFLSQQHELMNSYASRNSLQLARPASLTQAADAAATSIITPEFMAHMEKTAQELVSLCDMLTETLISLDVEEDPSANGVVKDMMADITRRKHAHVNFVGMLGSEHIDALAKLTAATDSVDRCMWLYEKTLSSHNEWRAIQESLQSSAARDPPGSAAAASYSRAPAGFAGSSQPESSRSAAWLIDMSSAAAGPSSAPAVASTSRAHLGSVRGGAIARADSSSSGSSAGPGGAAEPSLLQRIGEGSHTGAALRHPPSPAHGMSSKARGKMADTSMPDIHEQGYFGPDSAYGGSGERAGL
ncbi:hypothetical protein H4R21_003510 [Coemansia helicoidea]|uniref:Uncharacterized protein n=1 Tax=Coemansia helicoidea TaxID=1286919 RepID=A0ACC1L2J5_9FUNG|nr:hypothetical protein H4R21_003510 [Coemansia helicoidea]